ncbi:hypothetical protein [Peribacillus frigoritolerans]|uniref:hypothetical protein n=1 Tax=Peribacillus frigoritolerans TaxID=450367 RepID=UPI003F7FA973
MKINVEIDKEIKAIELLIRNREWNEEVQVLMECLKERKRPYFVGRKGEMQHVFPGRRNHLFVHRARFDNGADETGIFEMKERLYELERELPGAFLVSLGQLLVSLVLLQASLERILVNLMFLLVSLEQILVKHRNEHAFFHCHYDAS